MKRWAAALALGLTACAAAPGTVERPALEPDADGAAVIGSPLRIDFGRAQEGAVAAVSRLEGSGPVATGACGDGVRYFRWRSGLSIHVRDGAFLGWARPDGTSAGIVCEV